MRATGAATLRSSAACSAVGLRLAGRRAATDSKHTSAKSARNKPATDTSRCRRLVLANAGKQDKQPKSTGSLADKSKENDAKLYESVEVHARLVLPDEAVIPSDEQAEPAVEDADDRAAQEGVEAALSHITAMTRQPKKKIAVKRRLMIAVDEHTVSALLYPHIAHITSSRVLNNNVRPVMERYGMLRNEIRTNDM
eukprot:8472721-Pyramimonas_sp.AAC.3